VGGRIGLLAGTDPAAGVSGRVDLFAGARERGVAKQVGETAPEVRGGLLDKRGLTGGTAEQEGAGATGRIGDSACGRFSSHT
jgi:hypothetical protein